MKINKITFCKYTQVFKLAISGADMLVNIEGEMTPFGVIIFPDKDIEILIPWANIASIQYAAADRPAPLKKEIKAATK